MSNKLIATKEFNITLLYEEGVVSEIQLKIVDIRNKIIELLDKKPTISQYPDLINIIEPSQQLNIVAHDRKLIISNQDIAKDFKARDLENFLRIVIALYGIIKKPLTAFGLNYSFFVNFTSNQEVCEKQTKKFLNLNNLKINEKNWVGNGLNIAYMKEEKRIQIISKPKYDKNLNKMIGQNVNTNIHLFKNSLPKFADLDSMFKAEHDELEKKVKEIFLCQY